jgi:hypothetical protein
MKRLALLLLALAPLSGCHTLDRYRPHPAPTAAEASADPRPDLPGRPTVQGDALWDLERGLRARFPAGRPVVVRWAPLAEHYLGVTHPDRPGWMVGDLGDWDDASGPLVIEVTDDATLQGWAARDVLIHEWAHALSWTAPELPHGPVWASYFGLLYQATRGER